MLRISVHERTDPQSTGLTVVLIEWSLSEWTEQRLRGVKVVNERYCECGSEVQTRCMRRWTASHLWYSITSAKAWPSVLDIAIDSQISGMGEILWRGYRTFALCRHLTLRQSFPQTYSSRLGEQSTAFCCPSLLVFALTQCALGLARYNTWKFEQDRKDISLQ